MTQPSARAQAWGQAYLRAYAGHQQQAADRIALRQARNAERKAARPRGPCREPLDEGVQAMVEARKERAAALACVVDLRMYRGMLWSGGPVGGNKEYMRPSFVHRGLVSDSAPILKLFVAKTHRACNLLSGDDKARMVGTDSKLLALDSSYVETNKTLRGVLRVELDTGWTSMHALCTAIRQAGGPAPNVVVSHVDSRGCVWRPHLIWLLASSVLFEGCKTSQAAIDGWHAAQRALTAVLLPLGADPGGMTNPHRHKNPLSPLWSRLVIEHEPYSLTRDSREGSAGHPALQELLPDTARTSMLLLAHDRWDMSGAVRMPWAPPPAPDHPDAAVAAQSNGVWNLLRRSARQLVVTHRDGGGLRTDYDAALGARALDLCGPDPRARKVALKLARRVGEWTWLNWQDRTPRTQTPEELAAARKDGHDRACATKRANTLDALVAAIDHLKQQGQAVTQKRVVLISGYCRRTVQQHWQAVHTHTPCTDWALATRARTAAGQMATPVLGRRPCPRPRPLSCRTTLVHASPMGRAEGAFGTPLDKKETFWRPAGMIVPGERTAGGACNDAPCGANAVPGGLQPLPGVADGGSRTGDPGPHGSTGAAADGYGACGQDARVVWRPECPVTGWSQAELGTAGCPRMALLSAMAVTHAPCPASVG